jgi:hypothetical protein
LAVTLGPGLKKTSYRDIEGKQLAMPEDAVARPNAKALEERWQIFGRRCTNDIVDK